MSVALSTGSSRRRSLSHGPATVSGERHGRKELAGQPRQWVRHSADRVILQLAGMQQPAGSGADRLESEPILVVVDTTEPPVLSEAAAVVLLRILLRAAERSGMTDAACSGDRPVRSQGS